MSSTAGPANAEQLIREVYDFARAATMASGLPGRDSGPADAFRHMVGAAELARRVGALPAYAAVEGNETISWFTERYNALLGREPGPGRNEEDRAMDRINNASGIRIGLRAATPSEVLAAVKSVLRGRLGMERRSERMDGILRRGLP